MKIYDKGPVVTESTTDRSNEEKKTNPGDEPVVKIYDKSATSPFNQFKKTSMQDAIMAQDMRKQKIAMQANLHQMEKKAARPKEEIKNKAQLQDHQKSKKDAIKTINTDVKMQRESLQQRLADRRRRSMIKGQMNNSMIENSNSLKAFGNSLKENRNSVQGEDYVKKIISDSTKPFGLSR